MRGFQKSGSELGFNHECAALDKRKRPDFSITFAALPLVFSQVAFFLIAAARVAARLLLWKRS